MLGYPTETWEDIEQTIQHLKNSDPDLFTITLAYPIKGTGLYNQVEALQIAELDWNQTTDRDRDFKRTYSKRFYDFAIRRVVNEVHYQQLVLKNKKHSLAALKYKLKSEVAKWAMHLNKRDIS